MSLRKAIVGAAVVVLASMAVALAHPAPKAASPAPNAVLSTSPTEIRVGFTERLTMAFSGLELYDANNRAVAIGPSTVNPENDREMFAAITSPLVPGSYTVRWHAVSADTHRVKGRYSFQVKP